MTDGTRDAVVPAELIAAARARLTDMPALTNDAVAVPYRQRCLALEIGKPYGEFPQEMQSAWPVMSAHGETEFARIHADIMLDAMENFEARSAGRPYPASILANFAASYRRISGRIAKGDLGAYGTPRDLLWKELGIAAQRLIPGGARVIEPSGFLPRSLLTRGGFRQAVGAFGMFLRSGTGPYFVLHAHDLELERFNAEGWRDLMLCIAGLLRLRPEMKGVFVSSWIHDPQIPEVSPRLAYHRELVIPNGAKSFFYGTDGPDSLAFTKSATRRQLHAEGKYDPEVHMLVWERASLLRWAEREEGR